MKIILMLVCVVFLAGCSLLTQSPSETKARQLEENRRAQEKNAAINARTGYYEKQGLSNRDAKAAAESEYAKTGKR